MVLACVIQIDGWDPIAAAAVTLRAASRDDVAVCHLNAQTWWPAIAKLPTLRYDLFDGAFGGQIDAPSSTMALSIEPWPDFGRYALADARFRLWTGELGADWSGYTLRFDGRVSEQPSVKDGQAQVAFAVDDRWLDTALLPTYAGTTGTEGPAALKGQAKPLSLGAPRYVAGTLVDSVNSVFQLSFGPIRAVEVSLERLARFGASIGDFASYAALIAASVPRGTWATCLASGLVRFGAPPEGQISFLVQGDVGGPDGWARKPGQLIRRLALLSGGAGKLDDASLTALDAARPYNLSLYLDAQTTARQLIQQLAASINAVAGVSWTGQLFVAPIGLSAPTLTLAADGSSLPPVAGVEQVGIAAPWSKLAIGAERAWTVHALSDIAFTAALVDLGAYDAGTTYREGNIVQSQGSTWLYQNPTPTKGNAPPALPTEADAFWKVLAKAGAAGTNGTNGKDGRNGTDGAPGAPGIDGRTSYVHYAYANSPDGRVDFDLDQPNGRAYEGSYTDFTPADSANPAAYTWREYKGPPFGLAARGNAVVAAASIIKNGGATAWDSDGYSTSGYRGGSVASFRLVGTGESMAGLNTDPTTDASFTSIDYAIYRSGGTSVAYESGTPAQVLGPCDDATRFSVEYTGQTIRYLAQGVVLREVATAAGQTFYFDSSIATPGSRIADIGFAARGADGLKGADGRNGLDGANGTNGRDGTNGANGASSFVHLAYANSADGSADFTTGAVGGRAFVGIYRDQVEADSGDYRAYSWSRLRGIDGTNGRDGTPGAAGSDGRTPYTHFAYASSADGSVSFSTDDPTGRTYLGVYTDFTVADSNDYRVYSWSLIKGSDGQNGANGKDGANGANGTNGKDGAQGPPGVSAPQPKVITGSGTALDPIMLENGSTLSVEAAVGIQSNQGGTATLQIQASLGGGGYNVIGSASDHVGPGEPTGLLAGGSITNNSGARAFANVRIAISGGSVRSDTTNYLRVT